MCKVIGMAVILAGTGGFLFSYLSMRIRRIDNMKKLYGFLVHTGFELQNNCVDMGNYLRDCAGREEESPLGRTCRDAAEFLENFSFGNGADAWRHACVCNRKQWELEPEGERILNRFGEAVFGRYCEENLKKLDNLAGELLRCIEEETKQFRQKQKVLTPVTLLGGVLLCILLV
ncbi:MAG: stage III sporulation protein AB [Lachnospiraceae bacterium]|nr:stage III sporulation protein AB [Lachnospiraceae bacterium]